MSVRSPLARPPRGFSLIELGVVISVIAVMSSVVLLSRGYLNSAKQKAGGDLIQAVRNASRQHAQRNFKRLGFGTPGSTTPPALSMTALRASGLIPENIKTPWKAQATANDSGVGVVPDSGLGNAVAAAKCGGFTCMRVCLEVPDQETCDDMKKQFEQSSLVSECKANGCGLTGNFIFNVVSR